jgi:superfamily II DNA or RNA helicase
MDLFEALKVAITLPEKSTPALKIGGNSVRRTLSRQQQIDVELKDSAYSGYFELATPLQPPFNVIYLKKPQVRGRCPEGVAVLKAKQPFDVAELYPGTPLQWESYPESGQNLTPAEICQSWQGQFLFKEEDTENDVVGLRRPQLGALHGISAYFATDREIDPATVVLPTGTGKTETMLATMVYQRCDKILVIVPSDSLRTQISGKFFSLGYLPELGIVPAGIKLPAVAVLKTGIRSIAEADELTAAANVIVATTSVLSAGSSEVVDRLCANCSHLFVDEAHHISAKSWMDVRERFNGKKVIQFTATPFRNDKKALGGRIIYNYTMGEAQRAGYFTHVDLLPVEEYYDDQIDRAIAETAVHRLRVDLAQGLDHLMIARTQGKQRAESLLALYQDIAGDLNPIVVHSDYGKTEIRRRLEGLLSKQSKIVICVDMLGEGYDLPNLKIAALHDHHKSLAVTLQFIGRFTRVSHSENLGQASVVMNIADPAVEGDLQNLYSIGADWDSVLRRLSENRIEREVRLQEVVDALKQRGDLHNQLSLWNLEPSFTTILFQTNCENWQPEQFTEHLPKFEEHWHAIADDQKLLVVLAVQTAPVKWGAYKDLKDTNYKLLIAHWDEKRKALFIYANDYKIFRVEKLADAICGGECELLSGDRIFNVFNGIEYPLARNLGAAQNGAISFTQYFGPNVTDGLSLIEASQSSLSNIAALGYESGNRVVWGCSQRKGKVWSPQKAGSIADWCEWAQNAWDKIADQQTDEQNITRNFLRPIRLLTPHPSYPLSAQWGEHMLTSFEDKVEICFGSNAVPMFMVDLKTDGAEDDGCVRLVLSCEEIRSVYKIVIDGDAVGFGYDYELIEGAEVAIKKFDSDPVPLPDYMLADPVTIYYLDSSFSYNNQIFIVGENTGLYPKDEIESFDWTGTDIRTESMGYTCDTTSIQWRYFEHIRDDYDVIVNDDGSGESADLVGLKLLDDEILLTLVHAKYSGSDEPGRRLKDLYEVCGQAQRSVRWKHFNLTYFYKHIKRRQEQWRSRGYSRFLKGSIKDLAAIKDKSRTTPIKFHVVIVQPGLSKEQINDEGLKLLGSTALYVKKTTMADLSVIGSE